MAKYVIDNMSAPIAIESNGNVLERTLQNCKNLLMCQMGEVPYDRMRGLNPDIYGMNIRDLNEIIVPELRRVMAWEPDADVVTGYAEMNSMGETVITVVLDINA